MIEQTMLSDCEQMVMKSIWSSEVELGVQEVTDAVNEIFRKDWKLQTVSTFLARLVKKGYLSMQRKGRVFFYQPLISEKDYKREILLENINFWNAGKPGDYIVDICTTLKLTDDEKEQIKSAMEA